MSAVLQFILGLYKRWLSPMLPASCRYVPSCSEYAMEAIAQRGPLRGTLLAVWRVLRCHPFARGGYDRVCRVGHQSSSTKETLSLSHQHADS